MKKVVIQRVSVKKLRGPRRPKGAVAMNPQCRSGGCC
jgi:hypothetical protein